MNFSKIVLLLLLSVSMTSYSQQDDTAAANDSIQSTIHNMLIFKWCKEDNGNNIKRYIKIDSLGNVIIKNQNFLEKVNMKSFTKEIHEFIKKDDIKKIPGNNGPAMLATIPKKNEQSIYISIILTEDYIAEKNLKNKSAYSWSKTGIDKLQNDYPLFTYLTKKEVEMLKRFLE